MCERVKVAQRRKGHFDHDIVRIPTYVAVYMTVKNRYELCSTNV